MNEAEWRAANEAVRLQIAKARIDFLTANYGPGQTPGGLTAAQIAKAEVSVSQPPGFRLPGETMPERRARMDAQKPDDATAFALDQFRLAFKAGAEKIEADATKAGTSIVWHQGNGSTLSVEFNGMTIAPVVDLPRAPFTKLLDDMTAGKPGIKLEPIPAAYLRAAAVAPGATVGKRRRGTTPPAAKA